MVVDWNKFDRGVFLVNVLGIIFKDGKILIGKRSPNSYIEKLTWGFPGGRLHYGKTVEQSLQEEVKVKTNLKINIKKLIFARIAPEKEEFLNMYYFCSPIGSIEKSKAGEKFTELKWIKPTEIEKYFTTSIDPFILKFLSKLEKKSI